MTPKTPTQMDVDPDVLTINEAADIRPGSILRAISYANLDAEKVLTGFGTFGAFQMFVYALGNFGFILYACETMILSLITEKPRFECTDSNVVEYNYNDQCEYYDSMNNTQKCTSFKYLDGKHAALTSEFDLICSDESYVGLSTSIFMIGQMIFTPILTQIADLYGRRMAYLMPLWIAVAANIGCSFSPNYTLFLIFRFIAGIGTAGIGTIGFVIMLETISPECRTYTPFIQTIAWVAGYTIVGIVHIYVPTWKWQFFMLVTPFILTVSYYWLLPESIHWMITHKKHKGVSSWIENSSKFNKKELNLEECKNSLSTNSSDIIDDKKRTFMDIFKNGPMVFQLTSHCFIMIVMNFTYWALSLFSTELHENEMIGYFLSGIIELPAAGAIFLLLFMGRRTVTSLSLFAQAFAMLLAVFFQEKSVMYMSLLLSAKLFNSVAWVAEPLLLGEMSPTSTRNMFYGIVGFVGEIGSIIAPYFLHLKVIHKSAPSFVVGILSLIAGFLALCSPETKGVPMPEDVNEFDPGFVYNFTFGKKRQSRNCNSKTLTNIKTNVLEPILEEKIKNEQ